MTDLLPTSYDDFISQRHPASPREAALDLSVHPDDISTATLVHIYPGNLCLLEEGNPDVLELKIGQELHVGHREHLESILYFFQFVPKVIRRKHWTEDSLNTLYRDWLEWQQCNMTAEEIQRSTGRDAECILRDGKNGPDGRKWLKWFCRQWDALNARVAA